MQKEFWNQRFSTEEYIYGEAPNHYLRHRLEGREPGKILFPAEGEGRNAVYAAELGWKVDAFDQSEQGREKALKLADKRGVKINYKLASMDEVDYPAASFDALALIYAHMSSAERKQMHQKLAGFLKPGGVLILEAFSKQQPQFQAVNPRAGGPKDPDMLYNLQELKQDFEGFKWEESEEVVITLDEGEHHKGEGYVVRLLGEKL